MVLVVGHPILFSCLWLANDKRAFTWSPPLFCSRSATGADVLQSPLIIQTHPRYTRPQSRL